MHDDLIRRVIELPGALTGQAIIDIVRAVAGREFYRVHRRTIDGGEVQMIGVNALKWCEDLLICPGSGPNPMFFEPQGTYTSVVIEEHVWPGDNSTVYYMPDQVAHALYTFAERLEPALLDRIPGRCVVCSWVSAPDSQFCNQCGKPVGGNVGVTTKLVMPQALAEPIVSDENIQRLLLAVRQGAVIVAHSYDYLPAQRAEAKAFLYRMSEQIPIGREEFVFYMREGMSPELMDWLRYISFEAFTALIQRDCLEEDDKQEAMRILDLFAAEQEVALEAILTYLLMAVELSLMVRPVQ